MSLDHHWLHPLAYNNSSNKYSTICQPTWQMRQVKQFAMRVPGAMGQEPMFHCGSSLHRANNASCPAKLVKCNNCCKVGHFAKVCCSHNIRSVHTSDNSVCESVDIFCTALANIAATDHHYNVTWHVIVNGYAIDVICDSGAEVSVLPKHAVPNLLIAPTKLTLHAWDNFDLPILGSTACDISYHNKTVKETFLVVDLQNESAKPLFSFLADQRAGYYF